MHCSRNKRYFLEVRLCAIFYQVRSKKLAFFGILAAETNTSITGGLTHMKEHFAYHYASLVACQVLMQFGHF